MLYPIGSLARISSDLFSCVLPLSSKTSYSADAVKHPCELGASVLLMAKAGMAHRLLYFYKQVGFLNRRKGGVGR